ncbi:MAG: YfiR family protein [Burkholderiales bacterium]|nr:YfiR family protein [Burkholderiales bacterium]
MSTWWRACLLLGLGGLLGLPAAMAQGERSEEMPLKVAIAYNLVLFTQWPGEAGWPAAAPLQWCADPAGRWWSALQTLQDRPVRQARISLRAIGRIGDTVGCQVVMVEGALRAAAVAPGLLLMGDEGSASWTLRLERQGERMVFDVDLAAARAAGLQISSKALRLARQVQG